MTSNDLIPEALVPEQYQHKTFLKIGAEVEIRKCEDVSCSCNRNYHCPFCDIRHYKPSKPGRVEEHLEQSHWPFSVHYKDLLVVCCFRECGGESAGHFHCPVCGECVHKRQRFVPHLHSHLEQQGEDVGLAYAPAAKQPSVIIYNGISMRLCAEVCGDSPLEHYHCPACDYLGLTNTRICAHLRKCQQLLKGRSQLPKPESRTIVDNNPIPDPRDVFIDFWHPSMVRTLSDLKVVRCHLRSCCGRRYHCPLCDQEVFKPALINLLREHFREHWDHRITLKDYTFLACSLKCDLGEGEVKVGHYHCPLCSVTKNDKTAFQQHLQSCGGQLGDIICPVKDSVVSVANSLANVDNSIEVNVEDFGDDNNDDRDDDMDQLVSCDVGPQQNTEIKVFESVAAVLSRPLLEAFQLETSDAVESFLSAIGGAVDVSVESSPGSDPSQPMYSLRGDLGSILTAELILQQKFNEVNKKPIVTLKINNRMQRFPTSLESGETCEELQRDEISPSTSKSAARATATLGLAKDNDSCLEESPTALFENPTANDDDDEDNQDENWCHIRTDSADSSETNGLTQKNSQSLKRSQNQKKSQSPETGKKIQKKHVSLQVDLDSDLEPSETGTVTMVTVAPSPGAQVEGTSAVSAPIPQRRYSTRGHRVDVSMLASPRRASKKLEDISKTIVLATSSDQKTTTKRERSLQDVAKTPADLPEGTNGAETVLLKHRRSQRKWKDCAKTLGDDLEVPRDKQIFSSSRKSLRTMKSNKQDIQSVPDKQTPLPSRRSLRKSRAGDDGTDIPSLSTAATTTPITTSTIDQRGRRRIRHVQNMAAPCEINHKESSLMSAQSSNSVSLGGITSEISAPLSDKPGLRSPTLVDKTSAETEKKPLLRKETEATVDSGEGNGVHHLDLPCDLEKDKQTLEKPLLKENINTAVGKSLDENVNDHGCDSDAESFGEDGVSGMTVDSPGEGFKQLKLVKNEGPFQLSFYLKEKPSFIPIVRSYRSHTGKLQVDRRSLMRQTADHAYSIKSGSETGLSLEDETLPCPEEIKDESSSSQFGVDADESVHMTRHVERKATPTITQICRVCSQKFRYTSELTKHIQANHGHFDCDHCEEVFEKKTALNWHLTSVHKVNVKVKHQMPPPVSCGQCEKLFLNRRLLRSHMLEMHQGPLQCTVCGKEFLKKIRLRIHMQTVHVKNTVICDICGKTFSHRRYLRVHLKRHKGVKNHQCSFCEKRFFEANTLKEHLQTHKPRSEREYRYICSYCGAGYISKYNFSDHMNKHTGERPYHCDKCKKTFAYKTQLKSHLIQIHSDIKPFLCPYCPKCFKMKAKLQAHIVTHTGKSKHTCEFCKRAFGTPTILRKHLPKCKHLKTPKPNLNLDSGDCQPEGFTVSNSVVNIDMSDPLTSVLDVASAAWAEEIHLQSDAGQHIVAQLTAVTPMDHTGEPQPGQGNTFLFMCSACNNAFEDIESAEAHIMEAHQDNSVQFS